MPPPTVGPLPEDHMPKGKLKGAGGVYRCKVEGCKFKANGPSLIRAHYFQDHPKLTNGWRIGRHASKAERGLASLPTAKAPTKPRGTAPAPAVMSYCPSCGERLRGWRKLQ